MFRIFRILLWEFCRRGWWQLLNAQIVVLGVSAFVYSTLLHVGPLDPRAGRSLHFVLMWILFVASGGAALAAQGEPRRFYLLPLANRVLAMVTLLPGMVCVTTTYLLTAEFLNGMYGVGWPAWGPAVSFAASYGVLQTARRSVGSGRLAQFVVWCVIAILFESWLRGRYSGGSFLSPQSMWVTVTFSEWLSMGGLMAVGFLVTAYAIARDRCGDRALPSMFPTRRNQREPKIERRVPRFRSAEAAQFWFEWKQKGLILPGTFAAFAVLVVVGYLLKCFDNGEYELLHLSLGYGICLGPIAAIAGLIMGHANLPQANAECDSFLATRPTTNGFLSLALLKTEALSLLVTWALWIAGLIGSTAILYFDQGLEPILDLWTDHGKLAPGFAAMGPWFVGVLAGMCLVGAWIPLGLMSSLALTGRQRLLVAFAVGSVPVLLLSLLLSGARASGDVIVPDEVLKIVIGAVAGFITILGFAMARRRALIGRTICHAALAGWLAFCGLAGSVCWLLDSWNLAFLVFAAGVLALPWAPLATGPLALAWNRHR